MPVHLTGADVYYSPMLTARVNSGGFLPPLACQVERLTEGIELAYDRLRSSCDGGLHGTG